MSRGFVVVLASHFFDGFRVTKHNWWQPIKAYNLNSSPIQQEQTPLFSISFYPFGLERKMHAQKATKMIPTTTMSKPQCKNSIIGPHRHSTGCLDSSHRSRSNMRDNMDASEISLTDLAPTKPTRGGRKTRSSYMDNSSSRTSLTTANSSFFHNSSSTDFSRRRLQHNTSHCSWRSADDGRIVRGVRNLQGIQRRRSDPVTRRWREQCSKLYREHNNMLDSCLELPYLVTIMDDTEVVAARKIQAFVKRHLGRS